MVNYGNGKIYKIVSSYTNMIYIGSTTKQYLSQRMDTHKSSLKGWMKGQRGYTSSFSILLFDDAKIILLEAYPCTSIDELRAREQYYIDLYCETAVNCKNAFGADEELRKQYRKQYYKDNQEYLEQQRKQYLLNNKVQIQQRNKQYRKNNLEQIQQKMNQKYDCECGGKYTYAHKTEHERTQQHQNYINNQ